MKSRHLSNENPAIQRARLQSGGGDNAIAAIKAAGTRIQRTADRILSALKVADGGVPEPTSET